jgi:hypothetical protein
VRNTEVRGYRRPLCPLAGAGRRNQQDAHTVLRSHTAALHRQS